MDAVFSGLVKLLAPVIPYTAEESWQFKGNTRSVHQEGFPKGITSPPGSADNFIGGWRITLAVRSKVNEKLEVARREKKK